MRAEDQSEEDGWDEWDGKRKENRYGSELEMVEE
jgi:hypothetical protein